MAAQPLGSAGRRGAGVPSAGGVAGNLLPSSEADSRAPAAPSNARPGAVRIRTRACAQRARLPSLRRIARPPRSPPRCSMKANTLCSERTMYRILAANQPVRERRNQRDHPQYTKPELVATGPNQNLVLGHHQAVGAEEVDVLLPLRRTRHLQPLRGRLDGRRPGELSAGRSSHRADLPQTGRPAPGPHPALRPRGAHDQQMHRATARRPRDHSLAEPPPGQR